MHITLPALLINTKLTSLRKYYCPTGMSGQQINVGDIVLVHNDGQLINWLMAVVEGIMTGSEGLACSVSIQTLNGVTKHASSKQTLFTKENLSTTGGGSI